MQYSITKLSMSEPGMEYRLQLLLNGGAQVFVVNTEG